MKPDRLQRGQVALQFVCILILQNSQEEGPHGFEIAVHDQPIQDINSLTEIEEQILHFRLRETVAAFKCMGNFFRYRPCLFLDLVIKRFLS
jgi:hypothetical protein